MHLPLIGAGGTANGKPTGATAGVPWKRNISGAGGIDKQKPLGFRDDVERMMITVAASVTAAAAGSVILKLWGYSEPVNQWFPWDINPYRPLITTDANRGKLNNGTAIGEIDATDDFIRYSEWVYAPKHYTRWYAEVLTPTNLVAASLDVILWAFDCTI